MTNPSPEAIQLASLWVRRYAPWLWDRRLRRLRDAAMHSPLFASAAKQCTDALSRGWSTADITDAIRAGDPKEEPKPHVWMLLQRVTPVVDQPCDNLLTSTHPSTHPTLFLAGGVRRTSFSLDDFFAYATVCPHTPRTRCQVMVLVQEHGVNRLLWAADAVKAAGIAHIACPRLVEFFAEGDQCEREHQFTMRAVAAEAALL